MRGSKPGERRGGRQIGTPNKQSREIKSLAAKHGPAAIKKLHELMTMGKTEQTQAFAAEKLLDRGYGKPAQAHAGPEGEGPIQHIVSWQSDES